MWAWIQQKDAPPNFRVGEESSEWQWAVCRFCTCLLSAPVFQGLLWSLYGPPKHWPKTDRLPDISSAVMGLFGIRILLQFGVCNHKQSSQQGQENKFIGWKRSWEGYNKQRALSFSLAESLPGKWVFLLPIGLCYHYRAWELPILISQLYLVELYTS